MLPLSVSNAPNLVFAEAVNEFILPLCVSNAPNLVFADAVNEFKLPPLLSKFVNLVLADELNVLYPVVPVNMIWAEPDMTPPFQYGTSLLTAKT